MLESFMVYLLFFTRIPIRYEFKDFERTFKNSIWFLPIFGLLYGGLLGIVFGLSLCLLKSLEISLVILIVMDAMISGALHFDGLADTADGLFSGRSPERMKEIMRDSRIGSFGTVALISYVMLFFFALKEFLTQLFMPNAIVQLEHIIPASICVAGIYMVSKAGMAFMHWNYKYANEQGQGKVSENVPKYQIIISQVLSLVIMTLIFSWKAIIAYLITCIVLYGYKLFVHKKINGMTGDTLGATCQIVNIVFVLALLVINNVIDYIHLIL